MSIELIEVVGAPLDVREHLYEILYRNYGVDEYFDNWYHQDRGGEFLVKRDSEGAILGVVRLMPVYDNDPRSRQVRQVAVSPAARGLGVGRELMLTVEDLALEQGAEELWLESRGVAYGFYGKLGYVKAGEEFISKLTRLPHCLMKKRIDGATELFEPAESFS